MRAGGIFAPRGSGRQAVRGLGDDIEAEARKTVDDTSPCPAEMVNAGRCDEWREQQVFFEVQRIEEAKRAAALKAERDAAYAANDQQAVAEIDALLSQSERKKADLDRMPAGPGGPAWGAEVSSDLGPGLEAISRELAKSAKAFEESLNDAYTGIMDVGRAVKKFLGKVFDSGSDINIPPPPRTW